MRFHRFVACGLLAVSSALSYVGAQAAVSTQTFDVTGAPSEVVFPSIKFSFSQPYELIALDLDFDYDGNVLSFDESQSKVVVDGVAQTFSSFVTSLKVVGSFLSGYGTDAVTGLDYAKYSFSTASSFTFNQSFEFDPAFKIAASALEGQTSTVTYSGELSDINATRFGDAISATATVTASTVPEPAHWVLLLTGGVVLTSRLRRRASAPQR